MWEHINPGATELPQSIEPVLPTRELAVESILARRADSPTTSRDTTKERVEMVAERPPSEEAITSELLDLEADTQIYDWLGQSVDPCLFADARLKAWGSNNSHRAVIQYLKDHFAPSNASVISRIKAFAHAQAERPDKSCHSCELCQRVFGSKSARDQHAQAKHADVYCGQCQRLFSSQFEREEHDQARHPDTYCGRCNRHFGSTSSKQYHIASSTSHHICQLCSDRPDFFSESDLKEHTELEHNYCHTCEHDFGTSNELVQHNVDMHNMCEICREFFMAPSNLNSVRTLDPIMIGSTDRGLRSTSRLTSFSTCKPTP